MLREPKKNGEQGLGRSRGGLSTKIHAAVDGLGHLVRFRLRGGERYDITEAANLIEGMQNVDAVVADKAFDAASLLARIETMNATAAIPPRANRKEVRSYDTHVYKSRNLIERFFVRIKHSVVSRCAMTNSPYALRHSFQSPQLISGLHNVHTP
jgi:transposase